jgi:hypothetical protein
MILHYMVNFRGRHCRSRKKWLKVQGLAIAAVDKKQKEQNDPEGGHITNITDLNSQR